jgi:16S rRNA (uracil1498-N3)-methyltransferase
LPHFLVPPQNVRDGRFHLEPAESRHLAVVLRKKPGDEVRLFDGADRSYRARLESVSPERVSGAVLSEEAGGPALPYRLRLFQGLPKGDKLEFILEKATELGAAEIVPVDTERSVARVPPDRLAAKRARWEKTVLAAAKQCGRKDLPKVSAPLSLDEALALCAPGELTLLPWEGEERLSLKEALRGAVPAPATINVFIGPEGGFSPAEVERARARGALPVTLGPLILRTETAAVAAAAAVLYELGVVQ